MTSKGSETVLKSVISKVYLYHLCLHVENQQKICHGNEKTATERMTPDSTVSATVHPLAQHLILK